ncbi:MAG: twin transmembrane helix small protein [Pseudomonadota bacterium]
MRFVLILFLLAIIYSLGSGLYYLTNDQQDSGRLAKSLTWRIGLSVALFAFLIIAGLLGWITPGEL